MSGPLQQLLGVSAEQRQAEQQQKQTQIASLGRLLDDPDVTLDAKEAIAGHLEDLTQVPGKNKGLLPLFTRIFHHQGQQGQTPKLPDLYGVEQSVKAAEGAGNETVQSRIARLAQKVSNQGDSEQGLSASPLPDRMVRRGSLTGRQLADEQHFSNFEREQGVKARYDAENDARTQQRQLAVAQSRNTAAAQRLATGLENRKILLGTQEQARARRDIEARIQAGMSPDSAAADVLDKFSQEEDLRTARRQFIRAQTDAIPERLKMEGDRVAQGWQRLDEQSIHNQVLESVANQRGDTQAANAKISPMLIELRDVRGQIKYFNSFPESQKQGSFQNQRLKELQQFENDLLTNIWQVQGEYTQPSNPIPERGSVSPRGGGARFSPKYVAPKVSQQDLNKLLQLP